MGKVHVTRAIQHSAATAWEWIRDFGNIHRIHPGLGRSWIEGEQSCGVGAERVCEMKAGRFQLRERVVGWREGESYTVDVIETSLPLVGRARATLGVRALGPRTTMTYMQVSYDTTHGMFGRIADALFLNAIMTLMMKLILRKLDRTLTETKTSAPAAAHGAPS